MEALSKRPHWNLDVTVMENLAFLDFMMLAKLVDYR